MAIDKQNFLLLYINFSEAKEVVHLIDLWNVKSVKVVTEDTNMHEYRRGKSILVDKQIGSLYLEVTLVENTQPKPCLPLYECKDGMQDFVQIKRTATYWSEIITNCIRELPHSANQNAGMPDVQPQCLS